MNKSPLVTWMDILQPTGPGTPWTPADVGSVGAALSLFGIYDQDRLDFVPGCRTPVPDEIIAAVRALGAKRREGAAPPKWAQILRAAIAKQYPDFAPDLTEAFVTIGLWLKVIRPETAKTPAPQLKATTPVALWHDLHIHVNREVQRCKDSAKPACGTTSETASKPATGSSDRRYRPNG